MSVLTWALMAASGVSGGFVVAVCGFGLGPVMMSMMPYFMPYSRSVAVVGLCGLAANLMLAWEGRRHINFKNLLPCFAGGLIASTVAVFFTAAAAEKFMLKAFGIMLIALSVYSVFFSGCLRIRGTRRNGFIAGLCAGTMTGLFSAGGPPIAVYMLAASPDDNEEYRGTLNAYFSLVNICAAVNRTLSGILHPADFLLCAQLLAAIAAGKWLGNIVFHRLDAALLTKLVYAYLLLTGVSMFFR